MNDRNKSPITHEVTDAVAVWLDAHGFKPVETEVPMVAGWVADLAAVICPTQTELIALQLIKRPPRSMRTKQCRKLIQSVITRVQDIRIERGERVCDTEVRASEGLNVYWNVPKITIDGEVLARDEAETLAVRDGFRDLLAMSDFWPPERLPFDGDIIHWQYPNARS
jgi:hypothetical protein